MNKKILLFFIIIVLFSSFVKEAPNVFGELPKPSFELPYPGKEDFVDYNKYGKFVGVGTKNYRYIITDLEGLADAVGEGIYPNYKDVRQDESFRRLKALKALKGNHVSYKVYYSTSGRNFK